MLQTRTNAVLPPDKGEEMKTNTSNDDEHEIEKRREEFNRFINSDEFRRIVFGLNYLAVILPIIMDKEMKNDNR